MPSVWRPGYTRTDPKTGKKVRKLNKRYRIRWRDAAGVYHEQTAFADKKASRELAEQLERQSARAAVGLAAAPQVGKRRTTEDLIDEYRKHLLAKGDTARHADDQESKLGALAGDIEAGFPDQITGPRVEAALAGYRKRGMSAQTSNHYLAAMRAFCRWLVRQRILPANPVEAVGRVNAEKDRRRERRALSDAEFNRLLAAAAGSKVSAEGLTGPQRAALYMTAAFTGFRASALASLTPADFDFSINVLHLSARVAKGGGRRKTLPIPPDVAAALRGLLEGQRPDVPVWPGNWAEVRHGARMLRVDLAAAEIPERDAAGHFFDFHALRGQYATMLVRAGVHPRVAQSLLDHSTIELTMKHYARVGEADEHAAVRRLSLHPRGAHSLHSRPHASTGRVEPESPGSVRESGSEGVRGGADAGDKPDEIVGIS